MIVVNYEVEETAMRKVMQGPIYRQLGTTEMAQLKTTAPCMDRMAESDAIRRMYPQP